MSFRFAYYSDLHLEFEINRTGRPLRSAWRPPANLDVDAILLAGDIETTPGRFGEFMADVRESQRDDTALVVVLGNHERYGRDSDITRSHLNYAAAIGSLPNTYLLENDEISLASGVRVLGGTLWSNLSNPLDAARAREGMNDHSRFRIDGRRATPADTTALFNASRAWLEQRLMASAKDRTIVMTHYAPSFKSNRRFMGSPLSPAFCSDLDALLEAAGPAVWVHGHLHESVDYYIGTTRVLCNPRGYARYELNASFCNAVAEI